MEDQESYLNEEEVSQGLNKAGNAATQFGQGMYGGIKSGIKDFKDIKNHGLQSSNKDLDDTKKEPEIPEPKNQNPNSTGAPNQLPGSDNSNNPLDKNKDEEGTKKDDDKKEKSKKDDGKKELRPRYKNQCSRNNEQKPCSRAFYHYQHSENTPYKYDSDSLLKPHVPAHHYLTQLFF